MPQKKDAIKVGGLLAFTALALVWIQGVRVKGVNWSLAGIPRYLGRSRDQRAVKLPHFLNLVDERAPTPEDIQRSEKTLRSLQRAIDRYRPDVIERHLASFYHNISPMLEMQEAGVQTREFITDLRGITYFLLNQPPRAQSMAMQWAVCWSKQEKILPPEKMMVADSIIAAVCLYCKRTIRSERKWVSPKEADEVIELIKMAEQALIDEGAEEGRIRAIESMWSYVSTHQLEVA